MSSLSVQKRSWMHYAGLAAALTMVSVCLMGCSTDWDPTRWKTPDVASLVPTRNPELPEAPPQLRHCIKKGLPKPKKEKPPSADDKVLNAMSWGQEKQICGENLLDWYDGVKRANTDQGPAAGL